MWIKLKGANFSANNIGTLKSYKVDTTGLVGLNVNPKYVSYNTDGETISNVVFTFTVKSGYKFASGSTIKVGSDTKYTASSDLASGNTFTITMNVNSDIAFVGAAEKVETGGSEDDSTYTFTINPTPTSATVTLLATGYSTVTGTGSKSITVANGTTISWSVSASGYTTRTGNWTISGGNKIENVVLTTSGEESSISFTNDEFEIGALDGSGNPVALTTRYRTKNIKKFETNVLLTGKVLSGETNPAHVRVAQYNDNGTFVSMGQFADTATIPANTGFRLILERSAGGNVMRGDIELTVPTGATRLYVNTLKTDKAISSVTTPRETIQGSTFKDGLYYYGTVGETVGTVTSSSKMAAYEGYLSVNAGETVTVNVYTSATFGCVFADDTDKVILLGENSTFSGRDYQPLDFFTYEAQ